MPEATETIIIGAGQAGLSLSFQLAQRGRPHLVLEQADRPGPVWREQRWDSFTLVTPNWTFRLPGAEYAGPEPGGFMPRDEIALRLEDYALSHRLPVRCGVRVSAVHSGRRSRFIVDTDAGAYEAEKVVVATGMFQQPRRPKLAAALPGDLLQLHTAQYRGPDQLLPGAVLVVGSGQSGCQIAEELYRSGRQVFLSVGRAGRAPRRYRGRDIFEWMAAMGFLDQTPDKLPSPEARFGANPHLSGAGGGHSLNLHQFARDGVQLLGRLAASRDGRVWLHDDLPASLAASDKFEAELTRGIDSYITQAGVDAPPESLPALRDGFQAAPREALDLSAEDIGTVIWATGFSFDFSLVRFPVFEPNGFPQAPRCATVVPGLYFLGLTWQPTRGSGLLLNIGKLSAGLADQITGA
jgi:putative flavoprotein involved in K+ transport